MYHGMNMPLTLESHLSVLSTYNDASRELTSMYYLIRKRLAARLVNTRTVFVEYSLHDASHSRTIIRSIERFLGENRIQKLSATDTFMILVCAYAHDYGMAKSYEKIYEILGSKPFIDFLYKKYNNPSGLDEDDIEAIRDLKNHIDGGNNSNIPLNRLYRSIMHAVQLFLRPKHYEGVYNIKNDFEGLFGEDLKERFIFGSEGIVEICMCHGKDFKSLFELSQHADGIVGDDFHPRFIAAMIRLGDLLDLDNGRFPEWFLNEINKPDSIISETSKLHAKKHQAITHLLITDREITIKANCESDNTGDETAMLISEWTDSLKEECKQLVVNWGKIAQPDFGLPPENVNVEILLDKKAYSTTNRVFQMQMSQDKAMDLLKGTSIYQNQYVGIRELLQNAVDASLLQMWLDIKQNKYKSIGISKNTVQNNPLTFLDFATIKGSNRIFSNYDITIELIKNLEKERVEIVVKDRGIGISKEDVEYIANIGSSEMNTSRKKLVDEMPDWLKPSGIFGIGIQSAFQIAKCIEFYTRQYNMPERKIALYSYGRSRGRVQVSDVPPNEDGLYFDNAIPGTNAKIIVDRNLFSFGTESKPATDDKLLHMIYYDEEFDRGNDLDILYAEICQACKNIVGESKRDYFNVHLHELTIVKEGISGKGSVTKLGDEHNYLRNSYFNFQNASVKDLFGYSATPLYTCKGKRSIIISDTKAYYWDNEKNRAYRLEIRPCSIKSHGKNKQVHVPQKTPNLYRVSYKFNRISQSETIYSHKDAKHSSHAGFLMWSIQILGYPPTDYLNIDRDRLRPDAINEEELFEIRAIILKEWCQELVEKKGLGFLKSDVGVLLSFIILFYQNIDSKLFKRFIDKYGGEIGDDLYIGSETIPVKKIWEKDAIFYSDQIVSENSVIVFEENGESEKAEHDQKVTEKESAMTVANNKEEPQPKEKSTPEEESQPEEKSTPEEEPQPEEKSTPEEELQPKEKYTPEEEPQPEESSAPEEVQPKENSIPEKEKKIPFGEGVDQKKMGDLANKSKSTDLSIPIMLETVRHFPHRIVHPTSIVQISEGRVRYLFTFGTTNTADYMITMDDYTRAVDYTLAMQNTNVNNKERKNKEIKNKDIRKKGFSFREISKKVFKPDDKYKSLIVKKFPTSFQKGENYMNFFDECIKAYILSPFSGDNMEHTARINKAFNGVLAEEKKVDAFVSMVEETEQFNKCVDYVFRNGVCRKKDLTDEQFLDYIKQEYKRFVEDFCIIMIKYQKEMSYVQTGYQRKIDMILL